MVSLAALALAQNALTEEERREAHQRLAGYFGGLPTDGRRVEELPWQLAEAGEWSRLVALLASHRLTPRAQQNVTWLLGDETLADVSSWADQYLEGNTQTALWHYLNIPPGATGYDRDRDCPLQPGVTAGAGPNGSVWMREVSTPIAASPALISSMKGAGPHRYASASRGGSSSASNDPVRWPALSKSRPSTSFGPGRL